MNRYIYTTTWINTSVYIYVSLMRGRARCPITAAIVRAVMAISIMASVLAFIVLIRI